MVNINIEVPEEIHKQVKLASVIDDVTLKDYIIGILEKELKNKK